MDTGGAVTLDFPFSEAGYENRRSFIKRNLKNINNFLLLKIIFSKLQRFQNKSFRFVLQAVFFLN